jgi:hypothetical protein
MDSEIVDIYQGRQAGQRDNICRGARKAIRLQENISSQYNISGQ